jgi:hypothetical protein
MVCKRQGHQGRDEGFAQTEKSAEGQKDISRGHGDENRLRHRSQDFKKDGKGEIGHRMIARIGIWRLAGIAVAFALFIASLQILFDVPVAPFLVPSNESKGTLHTAQWNDGVQIARGEVGYDTYPSLVAQRGVPAEFTLFAKPEALHDCNKVILFPAFDIEQELVPGDNVLSFTPTETGVFEFTCWMNHTKASVTVVESLGFPDKELRVVNRLEFSAAGSHSPPQADVPPASPSSVLPEAGEDENPVFEKPEKGDDALGGWLEEQLVPDDSTAGSKEIQTWTGWIFDRDCVGISPVRHTKACNLMGTCLDSGLGIFEYVDGKEFDTYTALETFMAFDGASKELAVAFLKTLPYDWKNNVTVTVTGYAVNNIPAADDEMLIPETDLSRVTHYLNGIHITEIKAAFIDGVSTNQLPEPNVVLTQP